MDNKIVNVVTNSLIAISAVSLSISTGMYIVEKIRNVKRLRKGIKDGSIVKINGKYCDKFTYQSSLEIIKEAIDKVKQEMSEEKN